MISAGDTRSAREKLRLLPPDSHEAAELRGELVSSLRELMAHPPKREKTRKRKKPSKIRTF